MFFRAIDIGTLTYKRHFRCFVWGCMKILDLPLLNRAQEESIGLARAIARNIWSARVKAETVFRNCILILIVSLISRRRKSPHADFCVPFEQHGSPTFSDYFANHRRLDNRRSCEEKMEAKDVPTCWINSNRGNEVERKKNRAKIFLLGDLSFKYILIHKNFHFKS